MTCGIKMSVEEVSNLFDLREANADLMVQRGLFYDYEDEPDIRRIEG